MAYTIRVEHEMVGVVTSQNNMLGVRSLRWMHHTSIPNDKMNTSRVTKSRTSNVKAATVKVLVPITCLNCWASLNDSHTLLELSTRWSECVFIEGPQTWITSFKHRYVAGSTEKLISTVLRNS